MKTYDVLKCLHVPSLVFYLQQSRLKKQTFESKTRIEKLWSTGHLFLTLDAENSFYFLKWLEKPI